MKTKHHFSVENLYISPFTKRRIYDNESGFTYEPMEQNLTPTGIELIDKVVIQLNKGRFNLEALANEYGVRVVDIRGMLRCLTGMSAMELHLELKKRRIQEVLRYSKLPMDKVAKVCGFSSSASLYNFMNITFKMSSIRYRWQSREKGDAGRYEV